MTESPIDDVPASPESGSPTDTVNEPSTNDPLNDDPGPDVDRHAWRITFVVWAAIAVFVMLWALFLGPRTIALLLGATADPRIWLFPGDVVSPLFAAKIMLYGGYLTPYSLNPGFVAMPLYGLVMVPVAAVGEIFNFPAPLVPAALLDETARVTIERTAGANELAGALLPTERTLFSPVLAIYTLLWLIPFLKVVRSLAWSLGARSRLWAVQLAAFGIGWFPAVVLFGHLEDGILTILVLYAVVLAARRQWTQVAIMLALAMGMKQTAVLVVPLFFFFVPRGERVRFTLVAASIPALLLVGVLVSDFASATRNLFEPPTYPGLGGGRTALFVTSDDPVLRAGPARYGAFICAGVVALWLRQNRSVPVLLAGVAVAFALRLPFETVLHMYYSVPLLVGALVYRKCRDDRIWPTVVFGALALVIFWAPEGSIPDWLFWPLEAVLLAAASAPVWVDVARRRFGGPPENDLVIAEAGFGTNTGTDGDDNATGGGADRPGSAADDADVRTSAPADGVIL